MACCGCQTTERHTRYLEPDTKVCRIHHIPLVKARLFTPPNEVGIEYSDDRIYNCELDWPNSIPPGFSFHRSREYSLAMTWAYCPRCEEEFQKCAAQFLHKPKT